MLYAGLGFVAFALLVILGVEIKLAALIVGGVLVVIALLVGERPVLRG